VGGVVGRRAAGGAIERVRPLPEEPPVFVHGDPNLGNVLFGDDMAVAGVIDWEDAAIADRRFDVATGYWFLLLRAPDVAGDFIAAYEAASGRPVRDLRQWLAFQTVRAWAVGGMLRAVRAGRRASSRTPRRPRRSGGCRSQGSERWRASGTTASPPGTRGRSMPIEALEAWREAFRPYLPDEPPMRVLDLGAGTGVFARAIAQWFDAEVIGVEPSAGMRREAAAHPHDRRIAYIGGDAQHIPLRAATCDAAWLSTVIHHIPDLGACAAELRRVLRTGAPVLIRSAFPGRQHGVSLFHWFPAAARVVDTFPSVEETVAAFARAGFAFERIESVPQVSAPSLRAFAERARRRADTTLTRIRDDDIAAGLAARGAAAAAEPAPVIDRLDLVVLR
jgi:ubiquinone/menaquinone biosynthesis C-methylase UbiE